MKRLILVVDDEKLVGETLVDILRGEGFEAVAVYDGASAVEFATKRKPDVVICDVMMPKLNGIEAAKQINKIAPETRVLLFSGQAATADLLEGANKQGFYFEVLAKPVKPELLLAIIRKMLGETKSRNHAGKPTTSNLQ